MSIIAARLAKIKPSPTIAVTTKANELKAAGKDVIGLGAGEPDFNTPRHIYRSREAGDGQAARQNTQPLMAPPKLKQAIVAKFKRGKRAGLCR